MLHYSDLAVFVFYFIVVTIYGFWIYKRKRGVSESARDYFLAEGSLTWWAIGASLIASNISAEQFIGMSGEGFSSGIAVAVYEWIGSIALVIVAVWFIPVYLKRRIFTMPQFLRERYGEGVALIMAVFWLCLYIFVNLTSILYLGSMAISGLIGPQYFHSILLLLALFALCITLGGMKVIGYTDVIQVAVLVLGGFLAIYLALIKVDHVINNGDSALNGLSTLLTEAPDHFHMIFSKPTSSSSADYVTKYMALPGVTMYLAGQWIANLNYWGCNQYITQRALGADLETARKGILFAGLLKIFMPIIVVLPGIAAYVLYQNGYFSQGAFGGNRDDAYSAILGLLPVGMRGLSVAALTAAIVASLAGKANSISTIFTLDIYRKYFRKSVSDVRLIWVGRAAIVISFLIAIGCCWKDLFGIGRAGGFTFIQKYTGFVSPGVFAIFILGLFWKRTTGFAAIVGLFAGFLLVVFFDNYAPGLFGNETILFTAYPVGNGRSMIPFMVNMGWSFLFTLLLMVLISVFSRKAHTEVFERNVENSRMRGSSLVLATMIVLIVIGLYVKFW